VVPLADAAAQEAREEKLPLVVMQRLSIWQMIIFRISKELNVT
jgi:hypothetical protein